MKLKSYKNNIVRIGIGVLAAVLIGFLFKASAGPSEIKGWMQEAVSFVSEPVFDAAGGIEDGFRGVFRFREVLAENEALKEENETLKRKNTDLRLTKTEKEELEELCRIFDYTAIEEKAVVAANITAMDESGWQGGFLLDKGSKSGVREGCAVVSGDGVVGKVVDVSENTAKVASILADYAKVSFQAEKKAELIGVLTSDGNGGFSGYLFAEKGELKKGMRLVTSGIGTYPEGLALGTVTRVESEKGTQRVLLRAKPQAAFSRLKKVGVVL